MIVVVEGPSAAGKTTWTARHCDPAVVVAEPAGAEVAAAPGQLEDPRAAAGFWVRLSMTRWEQAVRTEAAYGVAVCDGDPFKLHYTWALWRTGHATREEWRSALGASRRAFAAGKLGLADLILVTVPDTAALARRREADRTRRRRNFDLHVQLAAPLTQWYQAVGRLDPARVIWHLPADGVPGEMPSREPRTGTRLLEEFLAHLPAT